MGSSLTKLTVVCPAYEEEACLPFFHEELARVLAGLPGNLELEILYVDDGSRDGTLRVIKDLARQDSRVRFLSLSRNFGHQAALTAGLEHARGDLVITLDSDLQHPPAVIPHLLAKWREGFDVVLTIREEDKRLGLGKRLTSRLFYRVMRSLSTTDIRPAGSDFRLMTRKALDALLQLRERHRFLRGMVQWLGFPTAEVSFRPDERRAGKTKYTFGRMLSLAGDGLFSFSRAPLRVPLYLGFIALTFSIVGTGILVTRWLCSLQNNGWAWVFVACHFLGACILWSVGVLGEYLGRIYEQVKQRPLYVVKDRSPENVTARLTNPSSREAA